MKNLTNAELPMALRRRFVQGVAAGGVLLGLGGVTSSALAKSWATQAHSSIPELSGKVFDLTIGELPVNFTGAGL